MPLRAYKRCIIGARRVTNVSGKYLEQLQQCNIFAHHGNFKLSRASLRLAFAKLLFFENGRGMRCKPKSLALISSTALTVITGTPKILRCLHVRFHGLSRERLIIYDLHTLDSIGGHKHADGRTGARNDANRVRMHLRRRHLQERADMRDSVAWHCEEGLRLNHWHKKHGIT